MAQQWFYLKDGTTHGPLGAAQLKALAKFGGLLPGDLVRGEQMSDWLPATKVKGLFPAPPLLPVVPTELQANRADSSASVGESGPGADFAFDGPGSATSPPRPRTRRPPSRQTAAIAGGGCLVAVLLVCAGLAWVGSRLGNKATTGDGKGEPAHSPDPTRSADAPAKQGSPTQVLGGDIWREGPGRYWSNSPIPQLHDVPDYVLGQMPTSQKELLTKVDEFVREAPRQKNAANDFARRDMAEKFDREQKQFFDAFWTKQRREGGLTGWVGCVSTSTYSDKVFVQFGHSYSWLTHGRIYRAAKDPDCAYTTSTLGLHRFGFSKTNMSEAAKNALMKLRDWEWVRVDIDWGQSTFLGGFPSVGFSSHDSRVSVGEASDWNDCKLINISRLDPAATVPTRGPAPKPVQSPKGDSTMPPATVPTDRPKEPTPLKPRIVAIHKIVFPGNCILTRDEAELTRIKERYSGPFTGSRGHYSGILGYGYASEQPGTILLRRYKVGNAHVFTTKVIETPGYEEQPLGLWVPAKEGPNASVRLAFKKKNGAMQYGRKSDTVAARREGYLPTGDEFFILDKPGQ